MKFFVTLFIFNHFNDQSVPFLFLSNIYKDQPSASFCIILLVFLRLVLSCKPLGCFGASYVTNAFNTMIVFLNNFLEGNRILYSTFNYTNLQSGYWYFQSCSECIILLKIQKLFNKKLSFELFSRMLDSHLENEILLLRSQQKKFSLTNCDQLFYLETFMCSIILFIKQT